MLVEVSIVAGAVLAGAAAVLHFYDRFASRGFYRATRDMATANAKAIHTSLEGLKLVLTEPDVSDSESPLRTLQNALAGLPSQIEASVAGGIVKASAAVMEEQVKTMRGFTPEQTGGIQAMGTSANQDRALTGSLKAAVGASLMGPYGSLIEQAAPPLYDWLQGHPEQIVWALEQPFVQKIIQAVQSKFNSAGVAMRNNEWGT